MPILLFFARVIWAWELKLNFQRYFVVCVMKMKMKTLQVIALFYDPSLTDYPLFQTRRLNIFSILFFQAFSTPWFLFSNATNHHLVFFLLEIFNNIIQYQFDGMTLSIISWITYQFLCMSSWRTDTLMMFVVCSRDLSFLPLRLGGMQVNDLNNSWLSRQTYILSQMSEEIVPFFPGKCDLKSCESLHKLCLSLYRNFARTKNKIHPFHLRYFCTILPHQFW